MMTLPRKYRNRAGNNKAIEKFRRQWREYLSMADAIEDVRRHLMIHYSYRWWFDPFAVHVMKKVLRRISRRGIPHLHATWLFVDELALPKRVRIFLLN